jgi:hypothetical protein
MSVNTNPATLGIVECDNKCGNTAVAKSTAIKRIGIYNGVFSETKYYCSIPCDKEHCIVLREAAHAVECDNHCGDTEVIKSEAFTMDTLDNIFGEKMWYCSEQCGWEHHDEVRKEQRREMRETKKVQQKE